MSGVVYWITGLSGAGKTTVGRILYNMIKEKKDNVVFLDGDELRGAIAFDLGYTKEDRYNSARRNAGLCKLLADQGVDVICCTISMFEDVRKWSRGNNANYLEVYLKVPLNILQLRNQKNLYIESTDELVGIGIDMEEPSAPDLVFVNDGQTSPEKIAKQIYDKAVKTF